MKKWFIPALVIALGPHSGLAEVVPTEHSSSTDASQMRQTIGIGAEFSDFYTDQETYNRVYRNVMSWFGSTSNACVAFASTALRFFGVGIPQNGIWNGERVSLLTKPFSSYLQNKLGWIRIDDSRALERGDLVFTVDEPKAPGYPAHVFMHAGYADEDRRISLAVDNQGYTHERALAGDLKKDYSAFAYALRFPAE